MRALPVKVYLFVRSLTNTFAPLRQTEVRSGHLRRGRKRSEKPDDGWRLNNRKVPEAGASECPATGNAGRALALPIPVRHFLPFFRLKFKQQNGYMEQSAKRVGLGEGIGLNNPISFTRKLRGDFLIFTKVIWGFKEK